MAPVRAARVSVKDGGIGTCGIGFVVVRVCAARLLDGITIAEEAAEGGTAADGKAVEAGTPEVGGGVDMVSDTRLVETRERRL
jgi:hypothetical protein